jgi:cytochrome c peroxidase
MALASFLRVNWSGHSAWDHYEGGEKEAVSKDAIHGFEVFKKAGCALCHVPPLFSDFDFHNVGIGTDKKPEEQDKGRTDATKDEKDAGKFKTPTLRDVEKTGPYFHDGSVATLDQAIDLMVAGGKKNKLLDKKLKPARLSAKDKAALKAFLVSLTGNYSFGAGPELPK